MPSVVKLATSALAAFLASSSPALAQDADGDGAANAVDQFPCDATASAAAWSPHQTGWTLLAFEDQWPAESDLDFNDVVVRTHWRFLLDAQGRARRAELTVEPVALGGRLDNGLAIQLPVPAAGVTVTARQGSGPTTALALEADALATVVLSPNLRALFGGQAGPINADDGPRAIGERLQVTFDLPAGATLSSGEAPFDVFIFRAGDFGHQIHRASYAGTDAMNTALFGTGVDASEPGRSFVHDEGVPFALALAESRRYPREGLKIDELFPHIVAFAASAGASAQDFYLRDVVVAAGLEAPTATAPVPAQADHACTAPQACAVANGSGQQYLQSGAWGACTVTACNAGYQLQGGACVAIPTGGTTTWNPATVGGSVTLASGNLTWSGTAGGCAGGMWATTSRSAGRWYWEVRVQRDGGSNDTRCPVTVGLRNGSGSRRLGLYGYLGIFLEQTSGFSCSGTGRYFNSGDVLGVALDLVTHRVSFYANNALMFDCTVAADTYFPYANHCNDAGNHCSGTANFGASPFVYAPPAGFSALP